MHTCCVTLNLSQPIYSPYCRGWKEKSRSLFCRPLRQWWSRQRTCGNNKEGQSSECSFCLICHAVKDWIQSVLLWQPVLTRKWTFLEGYPAWPSLPSPSSSSWRAAAALWNNNEAIISSSSWQNSRNTETKNYMDVIQDQNNFKREKQLRELILLLGDWTEDFFYRPGLKLPSASHVLNMDT